MVLPEGGILQLGRHVFRCEHLSAPEVTQIESVTEEMRRAGAYVRA